MERRQTRDLPEIEYPLKLEADLDIKHRLLILKLYSVNEYSQNAPADHYVSSRTPLGPHTTV